MTALPPNDLPCQGNSYRINLQLCGMMAIPNVARRSNPAYFPLSSRFFRIFVRVFLLRCSSRLCPISDSEERVMSIATTNPATGEVLKSFDPISDAQLEQKLQRAVEAFNSFRKTTFAS